MPIEKRLSSVPQKIQLPHGIELKRLPFKIVAYNRDGSPKTFELQQPKQSGAWLDVPSEEPDCFLFAHEEWIRQPIPGKASE